MSTAIYLVAGFFLPLFPLSMVFNIVLPRIRSAPLRGAFLLIWPQAGILLAQSTGEPVPTWLTVWAVATSMFYGLRALALRDVGLWMCFLAASAWSLIWIIAGNGSDSASLQLAALGFSAPLALLALLSQGLERRFGAAYTGLYGGLAESIPRFSGVLVFVVLAVVATPLFPGFFTMLAVIVGAVSSTPAIAMVVALIWLIWSWAGARLLQGLIVGRPSGGPIADLSPASVWTYAAALTSLAVGSLYWFGALL